MRPIDRFIAIVLETVLLAVQPVLASTVELSPSASVTSLLITLSDICRFSGFDEETLDQIEILPISSDIRSSGVVIVSAVEVQRTLREARVNLANVVIVGASECQVSCPGETVRLTHSPKVPRHTRTTHLRAAIRESFEKRLHHLGGRVDVRFGTLNDSDLGLTDGTSEFDVRIVGSRSLGPGIRIEADTYIGGVKVKTIPMITNVAITKSCVISLNAINMKSVIASDDVTLQERTFEDVGLVPQLALKDVVGMRAKRFVPAGALIRSTDLESVPLVRRGQLIDVLSVFGRVTIRSVAKALGDGGLGELVMIQNGERRGDRLAAIVTGLREVSVGDKVNQSRTAVQLALGQYDDN